MESRLENCLTSLNQQVTDKLFEYKIILVDDGSSDKSGIICDSFCKKYPSRFVVFHKKNGGVSSARNYGLDRADGEYISFVDPDDYVSRYYLINLFKSLNYAKADISSCCFKEIWNEKNSITNSYSTLDDIQILSNKEALKKLFYQDELEFAVWGKLFKRNLFNKVCFPVGIRYEDVLVTYKLVEKSNKIVIIDNQDYYYWQRKNGMLNSKFNISKLDIISVMDNLYNLVLKNYPELKSAVSCRCFAGLSNVFFQIPKNIHERNVIWQNMKKVRNTVLLDRQASQKVRLGALCTYFGKGLMSFIYSNTQKRGKL